MRTWVVVLAAAALTTSVLAWQTTRGEDAGRGSAEGALAARGGQAESTSPEGAAVVSARHFLDAYVEPDGRVSRPDQGDDTVSEGQAYALLLAVAADDEARFDLVWDWTTSELARGDGLLAWHWADGAVVDEAPAADADLDAARALLLAGDRWQRSDLLAAGRALGEALAEHEVVSSPTGPVLLAGPWAVGPPTVVNPSYGSPRAYDVLLAAGVSGPWDELAVGDRARLEGVGVPAGRLPPDWAHLDDAGHLEPVGPPWAPDDSPSWSFDAARVPIRLAESCDPADRALAAALAATLGEGASTRMALDGGEQAAAHPLGLVARAAVADAAGDDARAGRLLAAAVELEEAQPSYFGAAWVALGRVMLTTDLLNPC